VKKFLTFLLLVFIALLVAGLYGVVHDQISFTVSSEYFTKFKFRQFGLLGSPLPERLKVAIVGFLASWWMGIPIGVIIGLVALIHRDSRRMFKVALDSFALVTGLTLVIGLAGLGYGFYRTSSIDLAEYRSWFIPRGVTDLRRFLCAGYMHNASYLGGAISIPVAIVFHVIRRNGSRRNEIS